MQKQAYLYEKLNDNLVRCQTCSHYCVIKPGYRGKCGVRGNKDGELVLLTYGQAIASQIDPIEKKPFFHFLPGSQTFSIATLGCNLNCSNCQNWEISQSAKEKLSTKEIMTLGEKLLPQEITKKARDNICPSISYTYTEPTVYLEYALDTMKLARAIGLKNCWVSNGFMSPQTRELILPYLDTINVDLKFFDDGSYRQHCGARLEPILENLRAFKKAGVWLEITTLSIPTLSDSEEMFSKMAYFIANDLGKETPWHISQFEPEISFRLHDLPRTPVETLELACDTGLKAGLKYVYSGNVPGLASEDTYCPKCKAKMIDRQGYEVVRIDKDGVCDKCGEKLDIVLG
ncbi:MAG: AmmeMemoRadiSam system radical SAM enzyme [Candidatus Portnoybacteria bacterium CG06_land_8_20_14_3_00_39_12]|uniref:AmmeMemoRadiSam system radical SAM enzyme n=2 Tax=Candidatus Portnoyibacteriota TaxID=1817913 RepID=A0A2M7UH46_9BACT|nr:MAG: AmmeMemoRadiSam system radical SAM enzyme [Candidatus Portnoybacteria bacterium CG06_land_8_20_14_3_00_39_12]PIZ70573.1 MAG: AmmeMemoRadiSam system radical SAM enzyme [Candidatus Portnoybacteria bacterium CG_4_10_14_0_2_um_filter_39_11]